MLSNKYIKQFYQFTEQSITGQGNGSQSKRFILSLGLTLLLTMAIGITVNFSRHPREGEDPSLMQSNSSAKNGSPPSRGRQELLQRKQKLLSQIPMYRIAAKQQFLQPALLRKADQIVLNEDDYPNESWVVMDKVIVIPKVIG